MSSRSRPAPEFLNPVLYTGKENSLTAGLKLILFSAIVIAATLGSIIGFVYLIS
jgi:hypothetical protein